MAKTLKHWLSSLGQSNRQRATYQAGQGRNISHPEQPLGFIPRSDPNFYFYSKR
jgi:hypothetical protein